MKEEDLGRLGKVRGGNTDMITLAAHQKSTFGVPYLPVGGGQRLQDASNERRRGLRSRIDV